jgi:hypothetical protein
LADGGVQFAPHWPAILDLQGHQFHIEAVGLGSRFLLGREVLDELEVCFEFGQRVRLRFRDQEA